MTLKKFTVALVLGWLFLYGISTVPTSTNEDPMSFRDRFIIEVNWRLADLIEHSPVQYNEKGETQMLSLDSSEATQFYLKEMFIPLLIWILSLHVVAMSVRGDFKRWGGSASQLAYNGWGWYKKSAAEYTRRQADKKAQRAISKHIEREAQTSF